MRTLMTAGICLAILSGCTPLDPAHDAKEAVKSTLVDPESARWREIRIVRPDFVCGEVNAKNSFGGYTGFSRFLVWEYRIYLGGKHLSDTEIFACCMSMAGLERFGEGEHYSQAGVTEDCEPLRSKWSGLAPVRPAY